MKEPMTRISKEVFSLLADSAVRAVGMVEGWCDDHDSWRVAETPDGRAETVFASRKFRAQLRRELLSAGVRVR